MNGSHIEHVAHLLFLPKNKAMANTVKAFIHPSGFYVIDCGIIRNERVGYLIGDTGVIELKNEKFLEFLVGSEESFFDAFLLNKMDNAITLATIGRACENNEMTMLLALINEKMEDFD